MLLSRPVYYLAIKEGSRAGKPFHSNKNNSVSKKIIVAIADNGVLIINELSVHTLLGQEGFSNPRKGVFILASSRTLVNESLHCFFNSRNVIQVIHQRKRTVIHPCLKTPIYFNNKQCD